MKLFTLCTIILLTNSLFGQASFNGNVSEMASKKALKNVKLMVIEESDTSYFTPDDKGNFNFKTNPGRVKIFALADGYISELNSVNAGDGSMNTVSISMIKESETIRYSDSEAKGEEYLLGGTSIYGEDSTTRLGFTASELKEVSIRGVHSTTGEGEIEEVITYSDERDGEIISDRITKDHGFEKVSDVNIPKLGVLTAGEVNDFSKWTLWNDLNKNQFSEFSESWKLKLMERFCVQLSLPSGMPVIDAEIELMDNTGRSVWNARTDNTGKAELWDLHVDLNNRIKYSVKVVSGNFNQEFKGIHSFRKGINPITIDIPCTVSDQLDIAFVVDATGSMGDEINYLKLDLDNVISLISQENSNINLRMASVFYRDKGDNYVTIESPFSSNTDLAKSFIQSNYADGGGDAPEAADEALLVALQKLNWSSSSRARILFWILDAPPHQAEENIAKMLEVAKLAAKMGIKIVPVGCSGITKSTEFLCRSIALATNGTYTFLTNHSGVGASHIEPSTDGYKVESFRDILVRVSRLMSITPDCNEFITDQQIDMIDTNLAINNPYGKDDTLHLYRPDNLPPSNEIEILAYPNPTTGILNIKHANSIKEIFVADINGKLLERFDLNLDRVDMCDIGKYTNGIYFIQYFNGKKWNSVKVVLQH